MNENVFLHQELANRESCQNSQTRLLDQTKEREKSNADVTEPKHRVHQHREQEGAREKERERENRDRCLEC